MNKRSVVSTVSFILAGAGMLGAQTLPKLAIAQKTAQAPSVQALPPDCPDYTGPLDSVGAPVGQEVDLVVLSAPAPAGGITWNVFSSDPTILAAGNPTQGFIPQVFTPEGATTSSSFAIFGVAVGETSLIIQEVSPGSGESATPSTAWAVNPGNDSLFLDANFPYNTCLAPGTPNLSTDATVLASCGGNVNGTVSDGVSQLLLRVVAGLSGTACYSVTSTGPPDQGTINTQVITTQSAGSFDYGFSYYQAPDGYGDTTDNRQVQVQFAFAPNLGNSNTTTIPGTLTIIRPPLVLIHGLWSSQSAWQPNIWNRPNSSSSVTSRADYSSTNASNFSVNYPNVQGWVATGLQQARDLGYAATQADVVGHSMGGLLTRLYSGSSQYMRNDNYNLGDIHRFITLDTPHNGASLANLIVSMYANSLIFRALGNAVGFVNALGFNGVPSIYQGAICDLSENSPALQGLTGGTSLTSQVITATGGPAGTPTGGPYETPLEQILTATTCFPLLPVCVPVHIFPQNVVNGFRFQQQNDAIVPLSSQQGGIGGINFSAYVHTNVNKAGDVATQAFSLMDGPKSGFVGSLPGVISNGLGNPLTVAGLGASQDQSDYSNQCVAAGAPLNPMLVPKKQFETGAQVRTPRANVSPDSRVTISSPTAGQVFAPGATVNITVQLGSGLTATTGLVGVSVPGIGTVFGSNYNGTSFQASFVIPATFAGPVTLTPSILDSNNNPVLGIATTINVAPSTAPTSLSILQPYVHLTTVPSTSAISVTGNYPGNIELDLTSSATGTTYTSSNTNAVTVDANGNVQAAAFGTAVVTVANQGVKAFAIYVVESATSALPPQNDTTSIQVSASGFQLNRTTGFYVQTVTLTNSSAIPVVGPLYYTITGLPSGVTFVSTGGGLTKNIQPVGSPYLKLPLADGLTLQPGASVNLTLQFLNAGRARIAYTPEIYRTLTTP